MKVLSVLFFFIVSVMSDAALAVDVPDDVLDAVLTSPVVQAEIGRIRRAVNAQPSSKEEVNILPLDGLCGVRGCNSRMPAAITENRRGVNPQSAAILATVERHTNGNLAKVTLVELKKKETVETKLEIQRRYSSPIPVIHRSEPNTPREGNKGD